MARLESFPMWTPARSLSDQYLPGIAWLGTEALLLGSEWEGVKETFL